MRRHDQESGVALVEVVVYMVLAALLLTGIFNILSFGLVSWEDSKRQLAAQQAARMALDSMVRELRQAVKLQYDAANPSEIVYIEPVQHKKVRFYEHDGILYRDSDLIPQPIAGIVKQLRVDSLIFSVSPDFQIVDIELAFAWFTANNQEKTESLRSTVYCVNCGQETEVQQ